MSSLLFGYIVHMKYLAIFLGTFIEGPVVGLLAGFFSHVNHIQLVYGYLTHVAGDLSADMMYFSIGYFGGKKILPKISHLLKFKPEESKRAGDMFKRHSYKIIIFGKISHVFGFPILIGVGLSRYSWLKFLVFDLIATFIKSAVLIGLGYYFGSLWKQIDNILTYISLTGIILLIIFALYYFIRRRIKREMFKNKPA